MAIDGLEADQWYAPTLEYPRFSVQPVDIDFLRSLRPALDDARSGSAAFAERACDELEDVPWLLETSGHWIFNAVGRAVIDAVAYPGEVLWLPLKLTTPSGVVDDFSILAAGLERGDFLSEEHTTRSNLGIPIRWVLDREKLGDRQVLAVPGFAANNLVMRGSVIRALIDAGARGVVLEPARVVPRQ